ncbi:MAG: EsaB/YukD family protein [Actinomycetota bacterium]|nr:hypothetical protein [Actinomycetota bacterium]
MANIDVFVTDAAGTHKQEVSLPSDAPLNRVVAALVDRMGLPLQAPDGMPMSYKFHHLQTSRQLRDDATIDNSGVAAGDTLRLVPQITAG